ncbi:MAG: hypothetical protein PHO94_11780 [Petrimonas sp.]|nr:hypothetical protein [Petrimonas sp.]
MKQTILALIFILGCVSFNAQAQSYKLNKQIYDYKMYMPQAGDPYNPTVMGVASFLVPGLGQMISGETGRGIAFLGGSLALTGVSIAGLFMSTEEITTYNQFGSYTEYQTNSTGLAIMLAGLAATLAVDVWAIVDAVRVAKVNNMYMQDLREKREGISLQLNPYVGSNNYLGQRNTSVGLSLKATF